MEVEIITVSLMSNQVAALDEIRILTGLSRSALMRQAANMIIGAYKQSGTEKKETVHNVEQQRDLVR